MIGRLFAVAFFLTALGSLDATSDRSLDVSSLVGEHICKGQNPDGTSYEGTVRIRVKGGLVLMEWNVSGKRTYGTGLVEGTGLGVSLDDGVAIYQVVPQAEGKILIGMWAAQGAQTACEEVIFIGDTDVQATKFPIEKINGKYVLKRGAKDRQDVTVWGDDLVKRIQMEDGSESEGLLLGEGFAMITPEGLSVFEIHSGKGGKMLFEGSSVTGSGKVSSTSMSPSN